MKRKLLSVILSFLFDFSMARSVSATADGIEDGSTTISPRAHDVEAKRELVNTQTLVKHPIGYAKGQPSNGTVFPSYGGGFYWVDGGFGNSVTLNLNLGWGPISTSVSVGSTGGTAGYFVSAPVNKPCKLFVYRDLTCKRYANYERLIGTSKWWFKGYNTVVTPTRNYFEVRLV